jgi:Bacterial protein of unknown function (DUF916)
MSAGPLRGRPCRVGAAAIALLVALMGGLGVGDAWAAGEGSFGVRPAHFDPANPATRAYFIRDVAPGRSFSDQVIASNSGSVPLRLRVYAVDGLTAKTSGAVYANRTDRKVRTGTWVATAVSQIALAPHAQGTVAFTVRVPNKASPGDHLAGIAFEITRRPSSHARFSVVEVVREVVGVLVQVPGPARAKIALGGARLAPLPGLRRASLVVDIGNVGRKLCKPSLRVALSGPHSYRRTVSVRLDTILPGDTIPFPLPWPSALRPGGYHAAIRAGCPGTAARSQAALRLGAALDGPSRPSAQLPASSHGKGTPTWVFLAIALGGAALGGSAGRLRHRRRPPDAAA